MSKLDALIRLIELDGESAEDEFPFQGSVAIRTVTHYYTGKVSDTRAGFVILRDAAWIASTGRWSQFLSTGEADEVEPFPGDVAISLGAIVDVTVWPFPALRSVK